MNAGTKAAAAQAQVAVDEIEEILERVRAVFGEREYALLKSLLDSYIQVSDLVEDKRTKIDHLRRLFFGKTSEKTDKVCAPPTNADDAAAQANVEKEKKPGHGKNGAEQYRGATTIIIPHASLKAGDRCPDCAKGKLNRQPEPKRLIRLFGQAPIGAEIYELDRLRCNLCGRIHTAKAPADIGKEKYDASSAAMIALLKYGAGVPFYRLEAIQRNVKIPLPASTQWEIVRDAASSIEAVFEEHVRQAAQGDVLHNDDTPMKVLELARPIDDDEATPSDDQPERCGVFTTSIVSKTQDKNTVALYFTGHQHAGENLVDVLKARDPERERPIQMCDALSRNMPPKLDVIIANCIAHSRRKFVEIEPNFPEECRFVLECFREAYRIDAEARDAGSSPAERLLLHQEHSRPVMDRLKSWCVEQIQGKIVEKNSGLGQAIGYLTKHWDRLTLFLRQPGAPLDNNICERALKKAILHRKNALFYKTARGAHVGDVFMTLIHTAELAKVNVLRYLIAVIENADAAQKVPEKWMPWNYSENSGSTAEAQAEAAP